MCIVGAGYTGLWTAWALSRLEPDLRVAVVEAEHVGFGASGRNGGWLSGLMPGDRSRLARAGGGRPGVVAMQRALVDAVNDVVDICRVEGIDADIHVGGTLAVATNEAQMARLRASLDEDRTWGLGPQDVWELGSSDTAGRVAVDGAVGSLYSPHCARIQPAKLVMGLAAAVERAGVTIYEGTRAVELAAGRVVAASGAAVRAPWVVRATEGYTAGLAGSGPGAGAGAHRRLLPMNSSMIVTEPLTPDVWAEVGWSGAETLRDGAHAYTYLQRTADGRIALGGRGVPYRYGSKLDHAGDIAPSTVAALTASLHRLLPAVRGVGVAGAWSGVLGVARDWCPSVGVEAGAGAGGGGVRAGGVAWAGGYVGDGVTTSHLAGLTLADLILGRDTERTTLPWVGHQSRLWEPEPFRWLGVRGIYGLYRAADRAELRRPSDARTSRWAKVADRISGRP